MAVSAIPANPPTARQLQPVAHDRGGLVHFFKRLEEEEKRSVRVRVLNVKVLFTTTALFYHGAKIFLLDTLLIRNAYKIIKLLKKIITFPDGDNTLRWRAMLVDQKARHVLLKITYNCFGVVAGAYDLVTRNDIIKLAYAALGLGVNWQPFTAAIMSKIEFCLTPVICLKWATCASHFYLASRNVWKLDKNTLPETRYANWLILGKAALDFGIESLRLGLHVAGIATGGSYALIFSLAFLGIISNSLGMIKHVFPIKEMAEGKQFMILVPAAPSPATAQAPPAPGL